MSYARRVCNPLVLIDGALQSESQKRVSNCERSVKPQGNDAHIHGSMHTLIRGNMLKHTNTQTNRHRPMQAQRHHVGFYTERVGQYATMTCGVAGKSNNFIFYVWTMTVNYLCS